jgi:Xaa-Pro aminopeptidase
VSPRLPGSGDEARQLFADRLERVTRLLHEHGADALVVRRHENLAWVTGGGDLHVSREGDPVADAIVTADGLTVVTNRIEAARLEAEVLPPGTRLEVVEWHQPGGRAAAVERLVQGRRVLSDGTTDLAGLRLPLTAIERERFEALGATASRRLTDAVSLLEPGLREHEVAARVQGHLRAAGLELPVVLIAGEERFGAFRHPVVTGAPFGAFGLIVVCAQRHGLVASLSRIVAFGGVPELVEARLERVQRVEAAMLAATVPDVATRDVFEAARAAYEAEGERDAWRDHHQGGPAGYAPREWLATPSETRRIPAGTPVAWNPSLPLAKTEDTFWLGTDGLTNLTWDDRWPSVIVAGRARATVRVL